MQLTVQSVQLTTINGATAYLVYLSGTDSNGEVTNLNLTTTTLYQVGDTYTMTLTQAS